MPKRGFMYDTTVEHVKEAMCDLFDVQDLDGELCDHMQRTPERWAKAMLEMTTPQEFNFTTFPTETDEMIIPSNIPFVSLCAHHLLPFRGVAHVAYVPGEVMCGLSKLARTVEYFAKALQVQEGLTGQIANFIYAHLTAPSPEGMQYPQGVAVVLEAEHMCMTLRGIQSQGTLTKTSKMLGCFGDHNKLARQEFLELIRNA